MPSLTMLMMLLMNIAVFMRMTVTHGGDEENEWSDHSAGQDGEDDCGHNEYLQDNDTEDEVECNELANVPDNKTELKE